MGDVSGQAGRHFSRPGRNDSIARYAPFFGIDDVDPVVFERLGYGGVCALAENSDTAGFQALPNVLGHAHSGSGGDVAGWHWPMKAAEFVLLNPNPNPVAAVAARANHIVPYYWQEPNDALVAVRSADANLGGEPFADNFFALLHSHAWGTKQVSESILDPLVSAIPAHLDTPLNWTPLTAVPTSGEGVPLLGGRGLNDLGVNIDADNFAVMCAPGAEMNSPP